jgi:hypothetical protein
MPIVTSPCDDVDDSPFRVKSLAVIDDFSSRYVLHVDASTISSADLTL